MYRELMRRAVEQRCRMDTVVKGDPGATKTDGIADDLAREDVHRQMSKRIGTDRL